MTSGEYVINRNQAVNALNEAQIEGTDTYKGLGLAKQIIDKLPCERRPKREWIPTIERLPENGELVLCSVANSNHSVIINCVDKNQSYWHNGRIYAWQPLPEPYKAEGGE